MELPPLTITGIGSVPFTDPSEALDFVFETTPEVPYLPQLPLKGLSSQMLVEPFQQGAELFEPNDRGGVEITDLDALIPLLEYPSPPAFLQRFMAGVPESACAVKAQCVGPATVLRFITYRGTPLEELSEIGPLFFEALVRYAQNLLQSLARLKRPVLFFIDEPLLVAPKESERFLHRLRESWGIFGIHSCGATAQELTTLSPEILSVDCTIGANTLPALIEALHPHLSEGRRLALGASSIQGELITGSLIHEAFREASLATDLKKLLLTPACGLAFTTVERARVVFQKLQTLRMELLHADLHSPSKARENQ